MHSSIYEKLQNIMDENQSAFHYAEAHFEELMARPVAHVLYGPPSYGPGAVFPSQRMIHSKERILRKQTRRKKYKAYYFDADWNVLYSRDYGPRGVDCTVLHYWIGNTQYARFFSGTTNDFYSAIMFSTLCDERKPVRCALSRSSRVYAEYYADLKDAAGNTLTECTWYDYYPTRLFNEDGTPISKNAPIGAANSPISFGIEIYESNKHLFSNGMEDGL